MISAAGHFAEKIARPKLRQRPIHRKIDIRIDANELALMRAGAAIFGVVGKKAFHSREAAEKAGMGARAQVREGVADKYIDRSRDDVIGGRTKLAFLANGLAFAESMKNGRAFGPIFQLRTRHFLERRQIFDELIDAQRLATGQFTNDVIHRGQ